jgi:hypothetical protein
MTWAELGGRMIEFCEFGTFILLIKFFCILSNVSTSMAASFQAHTGVMTLMTSAQSLGVSCSGDHVLG